VQRFKDSEGGGVWGWDGAGSSNKKGAGGSDDDADNLHILNNELINKDNEDDDMKLDNNKNLDASFRDMDEDA